MARCDGASASNEMSKFPLGGIVATPGVLRSVPMAECSKPWRDRQFWIVTEADRTSMTMLRPDEY